MTRFEVERNFLDRYDVQQAGGETILEYWIPAEDLEAFNRHIVGLIEVVREFPMSAKTDWIDGVEFPRPWVTRLKLAQLAQQFRGLDADPAEPRAS